MKNMLTLATGCCILLASCNAPAKPETENTKDTTPTAKETKIPQSEFADERYVALGKKALVQFAAGNIDAWLDSYADSAMYRWSSGDSLAGKAAIATYWKNRRAKMIDSIQFSNDIWLPLKVNRPQQGPDVVGIWLLSWYQVNVKYKTGKKLMFWVHTDFHYDNNDKVDIAIQYIDRAPINKALGQN